MKMLLILSLIPIVVAIPIWWYIMRSTALPPSILEDDQSGEPKLDPEPDAPESFGHKMIWLAIPEQPLPAIINALGLRDVKQANWKSGLGSVYGSGARYRRVFVTPPINGWVLVAGALPEPGDDFNDDEAMPFLKEVAAKFPEIQYFGTHKVVQWHAWARFRDGQLQRAYSWVGDQCLKSWDVGPRTPEEHQDYFDPEDPESVRDDYWRRPDLHFPQEEDVLQVAAGWSINPEQIGELALPPSSGLVGLLPEKWGERL